jgi:hypothetical protein
MKFFVRLFSIVLMVGTFGYYVQADEIQAATQPEYRLAVFRVNALYATYYTGEVGTGTIAWAPTVRFNQDWSTRLLLGLSLLKDANRENSSLFLAPEIQLLNSFRIFSHFSLEAGGGLQKWWVLDGSTNPILTANIHYGYPGWLGPIDTIFIGYSSIWETETQKQVRAGIQLSF